MEPGNGAASWGQQGLEGPPNSFRNHGVAAGGGVDLIGLVQCGIAADAFEEERDEVGGIFFGERGIHGGEFPHVVGAE